MEQKKYRVEEKHRGDWQPLIAKDEKGKKLGQKTVKITEEEADTMNIDKDKTRLRYILDGSKSEDNEKHLDKMTKSELFAKAGELGVEFTDEHTNNDLRAEYLQSVIDGE